MSIFAQGTCQCEICYACEYDAMDYSDLCWDCLEGAHD